MAQDLRDLFREDNQKTKRPQMRNGHEQRFEDLLNERLPKTEKPKNDQRFFLFKIAAVLVVVFGVTWFLSQNKNNNATNNQVVDTEKTQQKEDSNTAGVYLSDISPEFKKIENYYLANINAELSQLNINSENKELIDSFMSRLEQLDKEYTRLNAEIEETGINEQSVNAMINNLELRLELLFKLKEKLKEMKKANLQQMQGAQI